LQEAIPLMKKLGINPNKAAIFSQCKQYIQDNTEQVR
jgi:hypothetical protein